VAHRNAVQHRRRRYRAGPAWCFAQARGDLAPGGAGRDQQALAQLAFLSADGVVAGRRGRQQRQKIVVGGFVVGERARQRRLVQGGDGAAA
jgi:hypothetical protein